MFKKLLISYILLLIFIISGCHFETTSGLKNHTTVPEAEENVPEEFTLLNSNDITIYYENIKGTDKWVARDIKYAQPVTTINQEILCSTIWHFDPLKNTSADLVFFVDDIFTINTSNEGEVIKGNYEIIDNHHVKLYEIKNLNTSLNDIIDPLKEEILLEFKSNQKHLFYADQLIDSEAGIFFGAENGESATNTPYTIGNIKVIKMMQEGITTERLMFRKGPDTGFEKMKVYYPNLLETTDGAVKYFLKGTKINVIARTEEQFNIGGLEDSWLYVSYFVNDKEVFGWVYGAYVVDYDQSKQEEYNTTFQNEVDAVNRDVK